MRIHELPMFDNHTHTLSYPKEVGPTEFARNFLHGYIDKDKSTDKMTKEFELHLANMGVVLTVVKYLSDFFGCDADLKTVVSKRNDYVKKLGSKYINELYEDANVIGTVVDSDLPIVDPVIDLFPCAVYRLFSMDKLFYELLESSESYSELKDGYYSKIKAAILEGGYFGLKCHVSEIFTLDIEKVSPQAAENSFSGAKKGEEYHVRRVYFSIFQTAMKLAEELDVPIHIHTGVTGQSAILGQQGISGTLRSGKLSDMDPFLMAPFLKDEAFQKTKIVLLHGGYPWYKSTAMMTHLFPNVYMDISWTLPWASLDMDNCLEEVLGLAPHSKIILGSGQHGVPEFVWAASKIAKTSLEKVLKRKVEDGLLSISQAENSAQMILYANALRIYSIDDK